MQIDLVALAVAFVELAKRILAGNSNWPFARRVNTDCVKQPPVIPGRYNHTVTDLEIFFGTVKLIIGPKVNLVGTFKEYVKRVKGVESGLEIIGQIGNVLVSVEKKRVAAPSQATPAVAGSRSSRHKSGCPCGERNQELH